MTAISISRYYVRQKTTNILFLEQKLLRVVCSVYVNSCIELLPPGLLVGMQLPNAKLSEAVS